MTRTPDLDLLAVIQGGHDVRRRVSFPVDVSDIRRWAVAVYWPETPPRWVWDPALTAGGPDRFAAPAEFDPFAWLVQDPSDTSAPQERSSKRQFGMNGGVDVTYGADLKLGDIVTSVKSLVETRERSGRHGPMTLSIMGDYWTNQRGQFVRLIKTTGVSYGGLHG